MFIKIISCLFSIFCLLAAVNAEAGPLRCQFHNSKKCGTLEGFLKEEKSGCASPAGNCRFQFCSRACNMPNTLAGSDEWDPFDTDGKSKRNQKLAATCKTACTSPKLLERLQEKKNYRFAEFCWNNCLPKNSKDPCNLTNSQKQECTNCSAYMVNKKQLEGWKKCTSRQAVREKNYKRYIGMNIKGLTVNYIGRVIDVAPLLTYDNGQLSIKKQQTAPENFIVQIEHSEPKNIPVYAIFIATGGQKWSPSIGDYVGFETMGENYGYFMGKTKPSDYGLISQYVKLS